MEKKDIVIGLLLLVVSVGGAAFAFGHDRILNTSPRIPGTEETALINSVTAEGETLAFFDFEDGVPEGWETVDLTCEPHWHVTETGAYEGHSYYCAVETPVGNGYLDLWEEYLETPEIAIPEGTTALTLTFVHKVDTESLEDPVWDGSAVFLSENGGPFHVIFPKGGYTVDSLRAFGYRGQRGTPGWAVLGDVWVYETFHLDEYVESSTIKVRYTFVSDVMVNSFDEDYSGVWVDEITLVGDGDTLFFDNGGDNAPIRMSFSTPCYGDFWSLTNDNIALHQRYGRFDYPPEGWTPGRFSMVCDDQPLINAALVSPAFTLPEEGYPRVSFYNLVEVPDFDGDDDYVLDDYFDVEMSTAESHFMAWYNLFPGHGAGDNDSTWEVYDWDRAWDLKLHAYCGQQIKLRWRLHTDADDNGGGGCDWEPCNGRGLFIDDFLLLQLNVPKYDVRITRIVVPFPNSVGHPIPVATEIANFGSYSVQVAFLYWEILDEDFNRIGEPPIVIPSPHHPVIAPGETTQVTFEWTPTDTGNFYIRAVHDHCITWPPCPDTLITPVPVYVCESWKANVGYFDRFSTETTYFNAKSNSGPAVRFMAVDLSWDAVALVGISVRGSGLNGFLEVYVFNEGTDDSTIGEALIEQCEIYIAEPQDCVEIDLGEYDEVLYIEDDFWVLAQAVEQTEGQFVARETARNGGRSWWYSDGEIQPISGSWEILAEIRHPAWAWCEGGALGDVNGDGSINVIDVIAAIHLMFDIRLSAPIDGSKRCRADCNRDSTVNVLDVLGIVNNILGLGSCPP